MKTELNHTPGPWTIAQRLQREDGIFRIVAQSTLLPEKTFDLKRCIATVSIMRPDNEIEANARLIASAPDLLAENKRLREALENLKLFLSDSPLWNGLETDPHLFAAMNRICTALANK